MRLGRTLARMLSCAVSALHLYAALTSRGVGRGGAKGAAAPPLHQKKKEEKREGRGRERKRKEE